MSDRKPIGAWDPQQYGGYTKRGHDVDFDGEDLEVTETVRGYEGYTSCTYIPKSVLVELLAEHGLHIVTAEEKAVLDAASELDIRVSEKFGVATCYGGHHAVERAELARRKSAKES